MYCSIRPLALSLSLLSSACLLSSCATLSQQECMVGDWQAIGYNDGVAGYDSNRLAAHTKACAKASIAPDYLAWERGRTLGLKKYCTVNNAYNLGKRGRQLNHVCPIASAPLLQQANQQGHDYYTLDRQLNTDKRLLKSYQTELSQLKNGAMLDFVTEKEARARLLFLSDEVHQLKSRISITKMQLNALSLSLAADQ